MHKLYTFLNKKNRSSFTLIELLIVIAILAVIVAAVIIVLNPFSYLEQSRDAKRLSDLESVNKALLILESQDTSMYQGEADIIYVSVPDNALSGSATSSCSTMGFPNLPNGWNYRCVSPDNYQKTDGTGWIPVNFESGNITQFSKLPIDPVNSTSTDEYYTYTPGGSWVLTAKIKSAKYSFKNTIDSGGNGTRYQIGTDVGLVATTVFGGAVEPNPVVSASLSIVETNVSSADADGSSVITVTVTVKDTTNTPIQNAIVVVSSTGSSNTISSATPTNSSGVTTVTFSSMVAEAKTISATADGTVITQTASVTFNAPCIGTNYSGADYTVSSNTTLSSATSTVLCNVGTFTVNSGITLTLGTTQVFEVRAVTVNVLGTISGTSKGYAPGSGSGAPNPVTSAAGAAHGGLGYNGSPSYGNPGVTGLAYDSISSPSDFGSGGNSSHNIYGGGYVKIVASGTATISGTVTVTGGTTGAPGNAPANGGGSGGSIYLSANTLAGSGSILAKGGAGGWSGGGGGGGRIAIYYTTKTFNGTVSAAGGASISFANNAGGAGTIYEKPASSNAIIAVDNGGSITGEYTPLDSLNGDTNIISIGVSNKGHINMSNSSIANTDVTIGNGSYFKLFGSNTLKSLTVNSGGVVLHDNNSTTKTNYIDLSLETLTLNSGGTITGDSKGYGPDQGPGKPTVANSAVGASHGGLGYIGSGGASVGPVYDSESAPSDLGSGANTSWGNYGGGYIKIVASGTATISGTITVAGGNNACWSCGPANGGGSGGSIYLSANTLAGSGSIFAKGAIGRWNGGGGGGGRIALYYGTKTFNGTVSAAGGASESYPSNPGQNGTVYDAGVSSYPGPLGLHIENKNNLLASTYETFVGFRERLKDFIDSLIEKIFN